MSERLAAWIMAVAVAASPAVAQRADPGAALEELVSSGALADTPSPTLLDFLAQEGRVLLPPELRERATDQVSEALLADLEVNIFGAASVMDSPFRSMMGQAGKGMIDSFKPGNLLRSALGVQSRGSTEQEAHEQAASMQQAMTDPWIRGLAAASALHQLGHEKPIMDFFRHCFMFDARSRLSGRCTEGVLELGPETAGWFFADLWDDPTPPFLKGLMSMPAARGPDGGRPGPPRMAPLEQAALRGLGAVVGSGATDPDQTAAVLDALRAGAGRRQEPATVEAAIDGLARTLRPEAERELRRLLHEGRPKEVRPAARRSLAGVYRDLEAIQELSRELPKMSPEEQSTTAWLLLSAGDEHTYRWARKTLADERVPSSEPDLRPGTVDALVHAGDPRRAHELLSGILEQGHPNEWLVAWMRLGLLRLGDEAQLAALADAAGIEDWRLGGRGVWAWMKTVQPLMKAALESYLSGDTERLRQAVLDLAFAEKDRYDAREIRDVQLTVRYRSGLAEALGRRDDPGHVALLSDLLETEAPAVRLATVYALLGQSDPSAVPPLVRSLDLSYGSLGGADRAPEIHAVVLRRLFSTFPDAPAVRALLAHPDRFSAPAPRLIALAQALR